MFTGIIEQKGEVVSHSRNRIGIRMESLKAKLGDSIAVNGVCLTVVRKIRFKGASIYFFDVSHETLAKTTLSNMKSGDRVNLEPALKASQSLGGHIVQGHVDGVATVDKVIKQGTMKTIRFKAPKDLIVYVVPKGSVTVDGVSLTASKVKGSTFSVALVPYTLSGTNLDALKKGDRVNLEADIIGKYVRHYIHPNT